MSGLMQDGMTAGSFSRNQILSRERGKENVSFSCSADHEQDWQSYPVHPFSAENADGTY